MASGTRRRWSDLSEAPGDEETEPGPPYSGVAATSSEGALPENGGPAEEPISFLGFQDQLHTRAGGRSNEQQISEDAGNDATEAITAICDDAIGNLDNLLEQSLEDSAGPQAGILSAESDPNWADNFLVELGVRPEATSAENTNFEAVVAGIAAPDTSEDEGAVAAATAPPAPPAVLVGPAPDDFGSQYEVLETQALARLEEPHALEEVDPDARLFQNLGVTLVDIERDSPPTSPVDLTNDSDADDAHLEEVVNALATEEALDAGLDADPEEDESGAASSAPSAAAASSSQPLAIEDGSTTTAEPKPKRKRGKRGGHHVQKKKERARKWAEARAREQEERQREEVQHQRELESWD